MKVLFSIILSSIIFVLALPCVKIYQLKNYNVKHFFESMFEIKCSFFGKNKLVFTKRVTRFLVLFFVIEFFVWLFLLSHINFWWLLVLDFCVNILLLPLIIAFLHYVLLPVERLIQRIYIFLAKKKLAKFKGIKIAIAGSYGKTSTKNILVKLLSSRYNVVSSPKSYNTPMGVVKTILKEMKSDTEIVIFEMGARNRGDIKFLCDIVKPDIGILTAVGEQHIETFKSLENVLSTKFELCESLINKICFFDCTNENTKKLYERASCKKKALEEKMIKKLKLSCKGSSFEFDCCNENIKVLTGLLGWHMIKNISLASMVALYLGVMKKDITLAIKQLRPVRHRLEVMGDKNLIILDDSYNSNYEGFREALNVLSRFDGEKIIVTPGLVELGEKQYEFNFKLGKEIANVCDKAIIMNQTNKKALKNGILSVKNDFPIYFSANREEQKNKLKEILSGKSVVLFENDLPDDYA